MKYSTNCLKDTEKQSEHNGKRQQNTQRINRHHTCSHGETKC